MKNARQAAEESGIECDIVKVTDIVEMLSFNPVGLPALVIDGEVKVARRVPEADEIKSLLSLAERARNESCQNPD
jgi:hypothetical protein